MNTISIPNIGCRPTLRVAIAFTCLACLASGCVGRYTLTTRPATGATPVHWLAPDDAGEGVVLERWRGSVGPPLFSPGPGHAAIAGSGALTLVSWNTALGAGDVARLFADMNRQRPDVPIVLLLQEVYRAGPEVPALLSKEGAFASRLRGLRSDGKRDEVEAIAAALQMSVYYVPSMRNGSPLVS